MDKWTAFTVIVLIGAATFLIFTLSNCEKEIRKTCIEAYSNCIDKHTTAECKLSLRCAH